ncbi:TPA: DUF551 domain-containing protein [Salmonella bongori]
MSNIDKQAREQLEAAERRMAEQSAIVAAAEKLVRCKGRYHSELNYRALAKLFGVITPDLPPLEHENVQCADAAEGFRIALASLESMTPEERAKHDASIEAFKEMLPQPAPVDKEFIPKNLDKALGVVGVALPESKEEFNFQIERWIQRLIDQVIRYADEFKEQPAPVVPDECPAELLAFCEQVIDSRITANAKADELWNDCRDAMLNGDTFRGNSISSTNNFRGIAETSTNSQVIPDGWISCSERMPEQAAYISAVSRHGEYVAGQVIDDWLDLHDGTSFGLDEVYLWMMLPPLPAAPQKEVK